MEGFRRGQGVPGYSGAFGGLGRFEQVGAGYPGTLQRVTPADLAGSVVFDRWDKSEQITRELGEKERFLCVRCSSVGETR